MPDDQRSARKYSTSLLVVEDNKDHQLLIQYSLLANMPQVDAVFASTPKEALTYLQFVSAQQTVFPRLVLLDIYLPTALAGWQLLKEIRVKYPLLPVIALSSTQDDSIIQQAYELGVSSFLSKPSNLDDWERCFRIFNDYWLNTITLPPSY